MITSHRFGESGSWTGEVPATLRSMKGVRGFFTPGRLICLKYDVDQVDGYIDNEVKLPAVLVSLGQFGNLKIVVDDSLQPGEWRLV